MRHFARARPGEEAGIAMVTAMLAVTVVGLLAAVVFRVAVHSSGSSAYTRNSSQAVHSAEGGLDYVVKKVEVSKVAELPCSYTSGTGAFGLKTSPPSEYATQVRYFSSYPPAKDASGNYTNEVACGPTGPASTPKGAIFTSKGTAGGKGLPAVSQSMEAMAELTPIEGATNSNAIQAGVSLTTANNLEIYGDGTPTADIYIGGTPPTIWTCQNNMIVQGDVTTQLPIVIKNNCNISGNVWTNANVTVENNAKIGGFLKSSNGSIEIKNTGVRITGNVTSGGTCTGLCGSPQIGGTVTQNSPQVAPPTQTFPQIDWDASQWTSKGWVIEEFNGSSACTNARDRAKSGAIVAKTVLHVTWASCTLDFTNNNTITLKADLAFFTNSNIVMQNNTTFTKDAALTTQPTVEFYIDWIPATSCTNSGMDPGITVKNNTTFTGVKSLFYSPCGLQVENNTAGPGGQFIGGNVKVQNNFTFTFVPAQLPTAEVTGFQVDLAYKRQVPTN